MRRSPTSAVGEAGRPAADCRFPAEERLRKRSGIREVFKKGRVASCAGAKLFFLANGLAHNRVAFTFARKFGNAVSRNRRRRLGREAYRKLRARTRQGYDLVLLAYPQDLDGRASQAQFAGLLARAGLARDPARKAAA